MTKNKTFLQEWRHWRCLSPENLLRIGREENLFGFSFLPLPVQFRVRSALLRGTVDDSVRHAKKTTAIEDSSRRGHIKTEGILSHHSVVIKPPKHPTTAKPIRSSTLPTNADAAANSMNLDSEKSLSSRPNSPAPSEMSEFEAPVDTTVFQRTPICGTLQKKLIAQASQIKRRGRPPKRKAIDPPLIQVGTTTTVSPKLKRTRAIVRDSPEAKSESSLEKSKTHRKMRSDNEFAGEESKAAHSRHVGTESSSMDESGERKSGTNIPFIDGVQRRSKRIRSTRILSEASDIDSSEPEVASKAPRREVKSEKSQVIHRVSGNFTDCDTVSDDSEDDTSQKFERLDVHAIAHLSPAAGTKKLFSKVHIPLPTRSKSGDANGATNVTKSNPQITELPRIPYKPSKHLNDSETGKSKQPGSVQPKALTSDRTTLSVKPSTAIGTVEREITPLSTLKSATPLSEPQTIQLNLSTSSATYPQIITMPPFSNIRAAPNTSKTTTNVNYPPALSVRANSPYLVRSVSLLKSPPRKYPPSGYGPPISDPQLFPATQPQQQQQQPASSHQLVRPRMSSFPQTSQQTFAEPPSFASRSFSQPSAPTQPKQHQHQHQQQQPIYFRQPTSLPPAPPAVPLANSYRPPPARSVHQQQSRPTVQSFYNTSSSLNQQQRPRLKYSQDLGLDIGRQNSIGRAQSGGGGYTSVHQQRPTTSSPVPHPYPNSAPIPFSHHLGGYTPVDRRQFSAPYVPRQAHLPYQPLAHLSHHPTTPFDGQQQQQQQQQQPYYFANNQAPTRDWGLPPK
ncbi:hypothetical protein BJ741DRAFT_168052 [Chytriomyces cf. hyalinus JEL632]|nr:hypothetical protein BJ741DRAFT_168052 [Chytriomyces cf. hyalinus JEL632]